jgi:hypothetical protein
MTDQWDEEPLRQQFLADKFVSLWIDWVIDPTFWDRNGGAVGLDWVPVSEELCTRFVAWWEWARYRHDRPGYSLRENEHPPFPDLAEFEAEGRAIAHAIKRELPDWRIQYYADYASRTMAEF